MGDAQGKNLQSTGTIDDAHVSMYDTGRREDREIIMLLIIIKYASNYTSNVMMMMKALK